jgi:hypothetical protein
MSTQNFYNKNASRIFANECEEEWDYEDLKLNLNSELAKIETDNLFIDWYENERHNGDRNYGGLILGTLSIEKEYSQMGVSVTLTPVIRSGYYGGVNLDWEMEYHIEGDPHDDIDDIDWEAYFPTRPFMYEVWIINFLEESADKLKTKVEKVFTDYSTPLNCVGVFSNGEAVYEKATI